MNYLIGIAGGSGSGKSTLAYGLQDKFPELIEVVHFDDYQKKRELIPVEYNMTNWDHPDAIDFEGVLRDLKLLKNSTNVEIMTKSEKFNPDYKKNGRIPLVLNAKKIIIVEGYMALTDERIRDLYDFKVFLDLDTNERMKRRTKFINPEYMNKILIPMHKKYIEPFKELADIVVNIGNYTTNEVKDLMLNQLEERKILQ